MIWGKQNHTLSKIDVVQAMPSGAALCAAFLFLVMREKRERMITYAPPPAGAKVNTCHAICGAFMSLNPSSVFTETMIRPISLDLTPPQAQSHLSPAAIDSKMIS